MKNIFTIISIGSIIVLFSACCKAKKWKTKQEVYGHTSQTSLDWNGVYFGNVPCVNCENYLTLNQDLTYQLVEIPLDDNGSNVFHSAGADTLQGTFAWINGNVVRLAGMGNRPSFYKVEENRIRQLDMEGKEILGETASEYILAKMGNQEVEDKRWQIVEINGKVIENSNPKTHYLIFHSESRRIEAKANCNVMLSGYKLTNSYQIKTTPGIATLMACHDDWETALNQALNKADNISVGENTLTINKARMAPLVKLKLVIE